MPEKLIQLDPQVSPQEYYDVNQELGVVPDGTGLQILFKIEDEYYIVAGPRANQVLTVNGGTIENKHAPFNVQLSEELEEETFGVMNLAKTEEGYVLLLNGQHHPLRLKEEQTFLAHEPGKFAYVTFTAQCDTLTLAELNTLVERLTPTASFWNKIGNHLFSHIRNAPKDETFAEYWQSNIDARSQLINQLVEEYKANDVWLVDPKTVFQKDTVEEALNTFHQVEDYAALNTLFRHTVGRYSERSGYYVFKASEVLHAVLTDAQSVSDNNGKQVAKGVFNDSCIKTVLPALGISMIQPQPSSHAPVSISPHSSMFSIAAPSNHLDDASLNVDFGQQQATL